MLQLLQGLALLAMCSPFDHGVPNVYVVDKCMAGVVGSMYTGDACSFESQVSWFYHVHKYWGLNTNHGTLL